MSYRSMLILLLMLLMFNIVSLCATERADIIVAKDGSRNFAILQAAIDSVPKNADRTWIILVKCGTYNEKILITKSNIAIVGEDRDSTRIIYAELRSNWRLNNSSDIGAAVISLGNKVTNLTLANLTIYNNYGALNGKNDHQFAIRGGGNCTKIILVNCNVWADGGDTMSLWNPASGMYYHANCDFKGYVDYVCPRGWCYITNSRFYGYNNSASIWHDGSVDSTSKFVICRSSFDGIPDFPLGRYHKDAQFYLLDCNFSRNMADRSIYPVDSASKYKWGQRTYYWNCHRDGGDYAWFHDNLELAYGGPVKDDVISALWTFKGEWDPERTMPAILPFASIPSPGNDAKNIIISNGDSLRWIGGRNAVSYNVYFGKTKELEFVRDQKETFYVPGELKGNSTYYWRIDVVTDADTIGGEIWKFSTR
jgi:pectinesterase